VRRSYAVISEVEIHADVILKETALMVFMIRSRKNAGAIKFNNSFEDVLKRNEQRFTLSQMLIRS
jgi:hypothetical protein